MSRFLSSRYAGMTPYTPGEQPQEMQYVKLNTNESPYPPAPGVLAAVEAEAKRLNLYSDPTCARLCEAAARRCGIDADMVLPVNGSDEILYFLFLAFGQDRGFAFPAVSYGFYPVYARFTGVAMRQIPLAGDFSIDPADYRGVREHILLANPNAPTGTCLPPDAIEALAKENPDRLVVVDEAYIDFGGESCVPLLTKYDNLLVTQTFSKSRSLAGARLGFGLGNRRLIQDLNTVKYSINPYNVNRMTQSAGIAAIEAEDYYRENCDRIANTREETARRLNALGFRVLPSKANFLFIESARVSGGALYRALKQRGVLVRHFEQEPIQNFCRVTVGTPEQMDRLMKELSAILSEVEKGK